MKVTMVAWTHNTLSFRSGRLLELYSTGPLKDVPSICVTLKCVNVIEHDIYFLFTKITLEVK